MCDVKLFRYEDPMLQPQIVDKPPLTVVGLEAAFIHILSPDANNFAVIGPLWDTFLHRVREIPDRVGKEMFGIVYARPEAERTHAHELQYIAAVAVGSTTALPEGMSARSLDAQRFAVFTHRGPIATLGDTLRHAYRVWLPQSGFQHAGSADVEVYDRRFKLTEPDSEMEYWIPIVDIARTG
jgi:AraC family transcriptional regulator